MSFLWACQNVQLIEHKARVNALVTYSMLRQARGNQDRLN